MVSAPFQNLLKQLAQQHAPGHDNLLEISHRCVLNPINPINERCDLLASWTSRVGATCGVLGVVPKKNPECRHPKHQTPPKQDLTQPGFIMNLYCPPESIEDSEN